MLREWELGPANQAKAEVVTPIQVTFDQHGKGTGPIEIGVAARSDPIFSIGAGTDVQDRSFIGISWMLAKKGVDCPFIRVLGLGTVPEKVQAGRFFSRQN
jgi:hypothetical protein